MNLEHFIYFDDFQTRTNTDWRLPENRLEAFRRVAITRMYEGDLDHWHSGHVISEEMGLSKDQKAAYALIFGQSYRNHWAMLTLQQFPDIMNTDIRHIKEWHDKNWKRAFYAKDTKWGLKKFTDYIESIQLKLNKGKINLYDYLENLSSVGNTKDNFYSLNTALREFYGIGRMTAWLSQQTIYEFFNFDIDYWDLQLYDDTWSQYDSLCYLFNREELSTKFNGVKRKPTAEDISLMESNFNYLMEYCNNSNDIHLDVYNIESCLCEYRKTAGAGGKKPKEFTFWTTNELIDQYKTLSSHWEDYDWKPYVAGLMTKGKHVTDFSLNYDYFKVLSQYGLNLNTHHYFKDEVDAHELLQLPKHKTPGMNKCISDWNVMFSTKQQEELKQKYDPKHYLKFNK